MKTLIIILGLLIIVGVVANITSLSRKGRDKWEARRKAGKSMLDDFDEERKNIDNLMK